MCRQNNIINERRWAGDLHNISNNSSNSRNYIYSKFNSTLYCSSDRRNIPWFDRRDKRT